MGTSGQRQGRAGRPHSPPHDLRACGVTTERRGNRVLKAILWDMDGVVADTEEAHLLAWRQFLAEQGRSVTAEQFATTFGMANPAILRQWFGDALRAEDIHSWSARKEALFRTFVPTHVRALPGAREWLRWGRERGYRQAIASSGEMANIVAVVAALEIGNQFDALVSGAFLPRSKPDPAVFLQGGAGGVPGGGGWHRGRGGGAARRHALPGADHDASCGKACRCRPHRPRLERPERRAGRRAVRLEAGRAHDEGSAPHPVPLPGPGERERARPRARR